MVMGSMKPGTSSPSRVTCAPLTARILPRIVKVFCGAFSVVVIDVDGTFSNLQPMARVMMARRNKGLCRTGNSCVHDNGLVQEFAAGVRLTGRRTAAPSLGLMHFGLMLAGLGTAMLGPILPLLARQWGMLDSQSGLLMMAKFCGAFLGGVTVSRKLRQSVQVGLVAGGVGFGGFAVAPSMGLGSMGLFVGGFGLGQIITSVNILAGRRFTVHRGSALSLLNFSFSLGAMLSALLAAWLLPYFALRGVLEGFAGLFVIGLLVLWMQMRGEVAHVKDLDDTSAEAGPQAGLSGRVYLYFAGLLVLYGGLETCLSGWLTTFALRYGDKTLAVSEYTTLLLWMSLTFGRAGASAVMLRVGEKTVQRWGMVLAAVFTAGGGGGGTAGGGVGGGGG